MLLLISFLLGTKLDCIFFFSQKIVCQKTCNPLLEPSGWICEKGKLTENTDHQLRVDSIAGSPLRAINVKADGSCGIHALNAALLNNAILHKKPFTKGHFIDRKKYFDKKIPELFFSRKSHHIPPALNTSMKRCQRKLILNGLLSSFNEVPESITALEDKGKHMISQQIATGIQLYFFRHNISQTLKEIYEQIAKLQKSIHDYIEKKQQTFSLHDLLLISAAYQQSSLFLSDFALKAIGLDYDLDVRIFNITQDAQGKSFLQEERLIQFAECNLTETLHLQSVYIGNIQNVHYIFLKNLF